MMGDWQKDAERALTVGVAVVFAAIIAAFFINLAR